MARDSDCDGSGERIRSKTSHPLLIEFMRSLTMEEQSLINERRAGFDAFFEDLMGMLGAFAEDIGLDNPHMIIAEPQAYLLPISDFLRDQVVGEEDRVWITMRIGFFHRRAISRESEGLLVSE